jgi:peptide methionine sulfoxide reductase MsrA
MGDHTECIQLEYDPETISYEELLDAFFSMHDPARAVHSVQYESLILYHDDEQERAARDAIERWSGLLGKPIATRLQPYEGFTNAEDYHQKYALRADRTLMRQIRRHYPREEDFIASTAAARLNGYVYGAGSQARLEAELGDLGLGDEAQRHLSKVVARRSG